MKLNEHQWNIHTISKIKVFLINLISLSPDASIIWFPRLCGIFFLLKFTRFCGKHLPNLNGAFRTSLVICESAQKYTYKPIRTLLIPRGLKFHPPVSPSSLSRASFRGSTLNSSRDLPGLRDLRVSSTFNSGALCNPQSAKDPSRQNRTRLEHVCRYESRDPSRGNFTFSRRIEHRTSPRRGDDVSIERSQCRFCPKSSPESAIEPASPHYTKIAAKIIHKLHIIYKINPYIKIMDRKDHLIY